MALKQVLINDNQMLDLTEANAIGALSLDNLREVLSRIVFAGFGRFDATSFVVAADSPNSANVILPISFGLLDGNLLDVVASQAVHILSGVDGTNGWGNGQAAHATLPRKTSVFISYSTKDTDPATKWFTTDTTGAEYSQLVNTRRSGYYHIKVVHGTPASSPVVPADEAGYIRLADVHVPAAASTILTANITTYLPTVYRLTGAVDAALTAHAAAANPHGTTAAGVGAIPATEKGAVDGVASLDASGKVPSAQLPAATGSIPTAEKGAANGVATLDASAKLTAAQLPDSATTDAELATHTANRTAHGTTAADVSAIPANAGAVTDGYIGNRTADDTQVASGNVGTLGQFISFFANLFKRIFGTANWYAGPPISLDDARKAIAEISGNVVPGSSTELLVQAGAGLNVTVRAGVAYCFGYRLARLTDSTNQAVVANTTNYVYIQYAAGSTTGNLVINTTGVTPTNGMLLATVTTNASAVSAVTDNRVRAGYAVYQ